MTERTPRTAIEYLDRSPAGWFVLDVMQKEAGGFNWAALMANAHPADLRRGAFDPIAYKDCWVNVPGEHESRDAAWDALEDKIATRH